MASPIYWFPAADDVAGVHCILVNCFLVGTPQRWVLVDAGLIGCQGRILRAIEERFGVNARPEAIILTHGHFDHVGALPDLADRWQAPIYAHRLELPYLTGRSDYPPPDPTVGGGAMARTAFLFPHRAYDFRPHIQPLPEDGSVPGMPGWRWVHTPGHAPGHVALFRESDRMLIAGDAFTTQKQESLLGVLTQYKAIHGPPTYFTIDWDAARESVRHLANLRPEMAATGHGLPMANPQLAEGLDHLAREFDRIARPISGRYVREPAITDENGVVRLPPPVPDVFWRVAGVAAVAAAGMLWQGRRLRRNHTYRV